MKLNVDYQKIHDLLDTLEEAKKSPAIGLTSVEIDLTLQLIRSMEDDYYPSQFDLKKQEQRIRTLNKLDYDKNQETFDRIISECTEFENKFC